MENENINGPVREENVPTPVEASQPVEPAETPPAEPAVTPTPAEQQPPAPVPAAGAPEPSASAPTPAPTPSPTPEPASIQTQASTPVITGLSGLLVRAKEKIQFRKRAKLEKIMALARSKGKITNNDIEKLLRCSDATATRYLAELVKQGRLKRVGPANNAFYQIAG